MRPRRISLQQFQYVAFALARESLVWNEPIPAFETRFSDRLESCLATPFARFGGRDLYRGIVGKSSILFYLLIKSHPFQNGNKRVAIVGLLYFLHRNGYWLEIGNEELYEFARLVAASDRKQKDTMIALISGTITKHLTRT